MLGESRLGRLSALTQALSASFVWRPHVSAHLNASNPLVYQRPAGLGRASMLWIHIDLARLSQESMDAAVERFEAEQHLAAGKKGAEVGTGQQLQ